MKTKKILEMELSEEAIKVLCKHKGQEAKFIYTLIGKELTDVIKK